jgi:hypothetical protein
MVVGVLFAQIPDTACLLANQLALSELQLSEYVQLQLQL